MLELLVVLLILILLASLSINIPRHNLKRAVLAEALGTIGTIKNAQKIYYQEHNSYLNVGWFGFPDAGTTGKIGSIRNRSSNYNGDLDGTYFSQECYQCVSGDGQQLFILCHLYGGGETGGAPNNEAPKKQLVYNLFPDQTATLFWTSGVTGLADGFHSTAMPKSGFEE